jgi:hypothetical protein
MNILTETELLKFSPFCPAYFSISISIVYFSSSCCFPTTVNVRAPLRKVRVRTHFRVLAFLIFFLFTIFSAFFVCSVESLNYLLSLCRIFPFEVFLAIKSLLPCVIHDKAHCVIHFLFVVRSGPNTGVSNFFRQWPTCSLIRIRAGRIDCFSSFTAVMKCKTVGC